MHKYLPLILGILLLGCSGQEHRGISVSDSVVTIGAEECAIQQDPIRQLKRCGLSPKERERALALMLMEKNQKLLRARQRLAEIQPSKTELLWMARMMYTEAPDMRSMTYVGSTVMERIKLRQYPNTVRGVITQRWAYEGITRGAQNVRDLTLEDYGKSLKWNLAIRSAWFTLTAPRKYRPLAGVEHFWSPQSAKRVPNWAAGREPEYALGDQFHFHDLID